MNINSIKRAGPSGLAREASTYSIHSVKSSQSTQYDDYDADLYNSPELEGVLNEVAPQSTQPPSTASSKRKASEISLEDLPDKRPKPSHEEKPIVVAHDDRVARLFRTCQTPYGATWEVARQVSAGRASFNSITKQQLVELDKSSTSSAVRKIKASLSGSTAQPLEDLHLEEISARDPGPDLDFEEAADYHSRLGCLKLGEYGGSVSFTGRAKQVTNQAGLFTIELEAPERSSSNRLTRTFMSKSFVRIKFDGKWWSTALLHFFKRPLVINGNVFRSLRKKPGDNVIIYVRTNECYAEDMIQLDPDARMPSFESLISRLNPPLLNQAQAASKYGARFDLMTSDTVPLPLLLDEADIIFIPDIYPSSYEGRTGQAPNEAILTDGAGFTNMRVLRAAGWVQGGIDVPLAIQIRIGGYKGMLYLHPDPSTDHDTKPRVWIRASQVKILYTPEISALPENRIIDLVRCSQMRINCRINTQVMINLAENTAQHERGRMVDIFKNLINATFKEIISTFSVVDDKDALLRLCSSIEKSSSTQRQLRHLARGARARGLIHDHKTEPWMEDEGLSEGEDSAPESAAWWPDPISGLPSTLEETVISLLASGFTPKDTAILRVKLLEIFKSAVRRQARPPKFYCTLQESCYGVLIPDPLGILQPGEIFVRSSRPFKIFRDGVEHSCNVLTGPVLVTRSPCMTPSDVQKVTAIDRPELYRYANMILFSVKESTRSLASMLGGGDYDGDTALVIWQSDITKMFRPPPSKFASKPPGLRSNFRQHIPKVSDILEMEIIPRTALQPLLLCEGYDSNMVGQYSKFHAYATYEHGYNHDLTWRLAYMFCEVLDGAKSGMVVMDHVFQKDRRTFSQPLHWSLPVERKNKHGEIEVIKDNSRSVYHSSKRFVMDIIREHVQEQKKEALKTVEGRFKVLSACNQKTCQGEKDPVLLEPWESAKFRMEKRLARGNVDAKQELEAIEKYVGICIAAHKAAIGPKFSDQPIEFRQDTLRRLSSKFHVVTFFDWLEGKPSQDVKEKPPHGVKEIFDYSQQEVVELMASCVYSKVTWGDKRTAWDMAFRALCAIKARSCSDLGGSKSVVQYWYDRCVIDKAFVVEPLW